MWWLHTENVACTFFYALVIIALLFNLHILLLVMVLHNTHSCICVLAGPSLPFVQESLTKNGSVLCVYVCVILDRKATHFFCIDTSFVIEGDRERMKRERERVGE